MLSSNDHDVLNELLVLHERSLAVYLTYASPWGHRRVSGDGFDVIREVADSHQVYVTEVGEMLLESDSEVVHGVFPMVYTGYHDLSIDFMLGKMLASEQATVKRLQGCTDRAEADRVRAIAERSLGASQAHVQELEEFIASAAS
jgi:hypothetical protein